VGGREYRQIGVVGCDMSGTASITVQNRKRRWFFLQIVMLRLVEWRGEGGSWTGLSDREPRREKKRARGVR